MRRGMRWPVLITAALLCVVLLLPAAHGGSVGDGSRRLKIVVATEAPGELEIIEDDVPLGLPAARPCTTHHLLLVAAAGLGLVYAFLLLADRRELNRLRRQMKENGYG